MPKRSTTFQRIVMHIAKQLAPQGAVVRESVELPEHNIAGVLREIDTVIEISAGITCLRVAIECRERGRRASVQWIDELIGKYSLLPVDRILAVSRAGYSRAAELKAKLHNIELLNMRSVATSDWSTKFDIWTARNMKAFMFTGVGLLTKPQRRTILDDDVVRIPGRHGKSESTMSVREFKYGVCSYLLRRLAERFDEAIAEAYGPDHIENSDSPLCFEMPMATLGATLWHGHSKYLITNVMFVAAIKNVDANADHASLGEHALLTTIQSSLCEFIIVQVAGSPTQTAFAEDLTVEVLR